MEQVDLLAFLRDGSVDTQKQSEQKRIVRNHCIKQCSNYKHPGQTSVVMK